MTQAGRKLALIGGTGPEGLGLAYRFAAAGREVIIGSRSPERAEAASRKVQGAVPGAVVTGMGNGPAAATADIIVLTIPFEAQASTLRDLRHEMAGKVLINTLVPLRFDRAVPVIVPVPEGSAAEQAAAILSETRVAAAFHHLSAGALMAITEEAVGDVVICSDASDAKTEAMDLARSIRGCRGLDGGGLANARHVEAFTAVLLTLNHVYKTQTSIRVVGV